MDAESSNSLQSIRYKRGCLQLLDQVSLVTLCSVVLVHVCPLAFSNILYVSHLFLIYQRRLPLETLYLDIHGATDGW